MKPTSPAEPQFTDGPNDASASLPAFVTRTTLQSILRANGVKTLTELGTHRITPAAAEPMTFETHKPGRDDLNPKSPTSAIAANAGPDSSCNRDFFAQ